MSHQTTKHVRMLEELLSDHSEKMNDWQRNFCQSVLDAYQKYGSLRPKQKAVVDKTWAEVVEGKGRQSSNAIVLPKPYNNWCIEQDGRYDFYVTYNNKRIGAKQSIDDATIIMDWLSNSEEDLTSNFCNVENVKKEDSADEVMQVINGPEEEEEVMPEPF